MVRMSSIWNAENVILQPNSGPKGYNGAIQPKTPCGWTGLGMESRKCNAHEVCFMSSTKLTASLAAMSGGFEN